MSPNITAGDADGWVPSPEATPISDRFDLDDVDLLQELTHEVRGAIMRRLKDPRTVAEIASSLNVPVTRLYHHVNRLHELGLIQIVATRQVAAVTERQYQVLAKTYGLDPDKLGSLDRRELAIALGGLFDAAKLGFQRMVESTGLEQLGEDDDHGVLSLSEKFVSPERRDELVRRLSELAEGFESDREEGDPDAIALTVFVAAYADVND